MFALQAVAHGGRKEYDAIVEVHNKPKTPTAKIAAMYVCLKSTASITELTVSADQRWALQKILSS